MIKVFMTNSDEDFILDLGDEVKEINLVYKFQNGIDPKATLKITTASGVKRIVAGRINNMQFYTAKKEKTSINPFLADLAWMLKGGTA